MSDIKITGKLYESLARHYLEWEIPKFSSLPVEGNPYRSQSFTFMNVTSYLEVEVPDEYYDCVTVSLESDIKYLCDLNVSFSIKRHDGTMIGSSRQNKETHVCDFDFLNRAFLQREEFEYLPEGCLTIICDMKFSLGGKQSLLLAAEAHILKKVPEPMRLTELDTLSENLKSLFVNEDSCDVILRVQEKEFNVHKLILKARSSVFASMFNHDTLENQTGIINIPDCNADSFHYFLEYLYCGKIEGITFQHALHLYSISDKYNVEKLKCFCVEYMKKYLTKNNVCHVIALAHTYDESSLLTAAMDFFNNNSENVLESAEWENLLKNNFQLANGIIKGVISTLKRAAVPYCTPLQ